MNVALLLLVGARTLDGRSSQLTSIVMVAPVCETYAVHVPVGGLLNVNVTR